MKLHLIAGLACVAAVGLSGCSSLGIGGPGGLSDTGVKTILDHIETCDRQGQVTTSPIPSASFSFACKAKAPAEAAVVPVPAPAPPS